MSLVSKYLFKLTDSYVELPQNAQLLRCGVRDPDTLFVYALIDETAPTIKRSIKFYTTGQTLGNSATSNYVDTVTIGPYIYHIFDHGQIN